VNAGPRSIKFLLMVSLVSTFALSTSNIASAQTTVTFDDLPTPGISGTAGLGPMPATYGGLNWTNCSCVALNSSAYGANPSGYQNAVVSLPNILSTAGFTITLPGGGPFTFNSAYITGAWRDGQSVSVIGQNGSATVDSTTLVLGAAGVRGLYSFNWNNLTSVTITPSGGTPSATYSQQSIVAIGVDNLIYTAGSVSSGDSDGPLPLWALCALGAGLVGIASRRLKKA